MVVDGGRWWSQRENGCDGAIERGTYGMYIVYTVCIQCVYSVCGSGRSGRSGCRSGRGSGCLSGGSDCGRWL